MIFPSRRQCELNLRTNNTMTCNPSQNYGASVTDGNDTVWSIVLYVPRDLTRLRHCRFAPAACVWALTSCMGSLKPVNSYLNPALRILTGSPFRSAIDCRPGCCPHWGWVAHNGWPVQYEKEAPGNRAMKLKCRFPREPNSYENELFPGNTPSFACFQAVCPPPELCSLVCFTEWDYLVNSTVAAHL